MTPNLLVALPHTPLYERLQKANRLNSGEESNSNIEYQQPYETVVANWKRVIREVYEPRKIYARYATQARKTYLHRSGRCARWTSSPGPTSGARSRSSRAPPGGSGSGAITGRELRQGNVESVFQIAMVAHHLITFGRACLTRDVQVSPLLHPSARGRRPGGLRFT